MNGDIGSEQAERVGNIPELLTHGELIVPSHLMPLLLPGSILVHPRVYQARFAFTKDFVAAVQQGVPKSMEQDTLVIREKLGDRSTALLSGLQSESDIPITFSVDPEERFLDLVRGEANIALDTQRETLIDFEALESGSHSLASLDPQKMKEYARESKELPGAYDLIAWYTHNLNVGPEGVNFGFYGRNFAIVFNNLGLDWLREGKL